MRYASSNGATSSTLPFALSSCREVDHGGSVPIVGYNRNRSPAPVQAPVDDGGGGAVQALTKRDVLLESCRQRFYGELRNAGAELRAMRRHYQNRTGSPAEEAEPQLFDESDAFARTQALITEMCVTDVATSTGAMMATIDKYPGLTLEKFTAENVQVAVSVIMDPGMWFQDPGQARRILAERGTKKLAELHEESLLRLRLAAGGPTAGCNYRTHAGRTDPMCTIVGELQPPPIRPAAMLDMPGDGSGEEEGAEAADGVYDEPAPAPAPAPASAPAPAPVAAPRTEEVGGAAALLRRLAAFEATPSESVLEVRVKDATVAMSYYRIRTTPDESAGLPLDVPSTLAAARDWVASHPSPWVQTWEVTDDYELPEGADSEDPETARRAMARAPPPLLCVRKTDPPAGSPAQSAWARSAAGGGALPVVRSSSAGGSRQKATVVLQPEDFREMLSA
jgi:hypothetical protein